MRKPHKEIKDGSVIEGLLNTCLVGRLATNGADGYPVCKPVNFAYHGGCIYIHTSKVGEKVDDIRRDPRVSFEADLPIAYIKAVNEPCEADYLYRSVIIKGKAYMVEDRGGKLIALNSLMKKYQPQGGYGEYLEEKLERTGIIRIEVVEMTGKEDLGGGKLREAALKAIKEGVPLPITLVRG